MELKKLGFTDRSKKRLKQFGGAIGGGLLADALASPFYQLHKKFTPETEMAWKEAVIDILDKRGVRGSTAKTFRNVLGDKRFWQVTHKYLKPGLPVILVTALGAIAGSQLVKKLDTN
jgi:hypothetical protein